MLMARARVVAVGRNYESWARGIFQGKPNNINKPAALDSLCLLLMPSMV